MRFDGNLAWQQAIRLFSANKELLLVLAGVFFFLPGLASAFFLADTQAQLMQGMQAVDPHDSKAVMAAVSTLYAKIGPYMALLGLVQTIGTMAMMALLTDSARPTVGQAISQGIRCLPTVLGVGLLLALGYMVSALVVALGLGLVAMAIGAAGGGGALMALVAVGMGGFMAFLVFMATRLSVTLPVVVIDQVRNPMRALMRSWWLTKGNTASLMGFYLVLLVAYVVIAMLLYMALTALVALGTAQASGVGTASGVVSGLIGGVVSVLATAIICAVHGQLVGPRHETMSEIFR